MIKNKENSNLQYSKNLFQVVVKKNAVAKAFQLSFSFDLTKKKIFSYAENQN